MFSKINDCGCAPVKTVTLVVPETNRIVGGIYVNENQHPYHARIHVIRVGYFGCNGSILNKRYILTASHCLTSNYKQLSHENNKISPNLVNVKVFWEHWLKVEKIIYHKIRDIALLKLKENLKFTPKILPACLPTNSRNMYDDWTGVVTGINLIWCLHFVQKRKNRIIFLYLLEEAHIDCF